MNFDNAVVKILKELDKHPEKFVKAIIIKKLKIGNNHFAQVMNYINHNQLANLKGESEEQMEYMINPKGKEYISKKESEKRQEDFTKIVALNAAIFGSIGIYTFMKDLNLINGYNSWISYLILFFILGCVAPIVTFIVRYYKN